MKRTVIHMQGYSISRTKYKNFKFWWTLPSMDCGMASDGQGRPQGVRGCLNGRSPPCVNLALNRGYPAYIVMMQPTQPSINKA